MELASNGHSTNKISKLTKMARSTVEAIKTFESATILQRKQKLADQFANIAHIGAERLLREVSTLPPGSLIPAVGMATDKVLVLTQDPQSQLNQHLHVHLGSIDLVSKFNETMNRLGVLPQPNPESLQSNASPAEKRIEAKEIDQLHY